MNRRDFTKRITAAIATLPFMGWAKPKSKHTRQRLPFCRLEAAVLWETCDNDFRTTVRETGDNSQYAEVIMNGSAWGPKGNCVWFTVDHESFYKKPYKERWAVLKTAIRLCEKRLKGGRYGLMFGGQALDYNTKAFGKPNSQREKLIQMI